MAQITGHIVQANGTSISEAVISVTAMQHSSVVDGNIFKGTSFDIVCGTEGSYSFPLAVGSYSIQVKTGRTTVSLDGVVIDEDTPDGIDMLGLVAYEGVSVTLAQQLLNNATALSIAQETMIMPTVLANDGIGSGLDADLFQGQTLAQVVSTPTPSPLTTASTGTGNAGKWTKLLEVSELTGYNGGSFLFTVSSVRAYGGSTNFTVDFRTGGSSDIASSHSNVTVTERWGNSPMSKLKMISNDAGSFEVWAQVSGNHRQYIVSVNHSHTEQPGNIEFFSNQPWTAEPVGTTFNKHSIYDLNLSQGMDTGWVLPTLLNGWVSSTDPVQPFLGVRKMPDGTVCMRGLITDGGAGGANDICVLPNGFRPLKHVIVAVAVNGGVQTIEVYTNGTVRFRDEGTGNPSTWLSLSDVVFSTEQ